MKNYDNGKNQANENESAAMLCELKEHGIPTDIDFIFNPDLPTTPER